MPNIADRESARALGLKRYFTGLPCRNGHVAERYVSCGNCTECLYPNAKRTSESAIKDEAYVLAEYEFSVAKSEADAKLKVAQNIHAAEITIAHQAFQASQAESRAESRRLLLETVAQTQAKREEELAARRAEVEARRAEAAMLTKAKIDARAESIKRKETLARLMTMYAAGGTECQLRGAEITQANDLVVMATRAKAPELRYQDIVKGIRLTTGNSLMYRVFPEDVEWLRAKVEACKTQEMPRTAQHLAAEIDDEKAPWMDSDPT